MKTRALSSVKLYGFLYFSLLTLNILDADAQGVGWITDYKWGRELALETGHLIVMDFFADWCPPCRNMDKNVWSDSAVVSLSRNFTCVKIDLTHGNAHAPFFVRSIPTIYIMDYQGNLLYSRTGYIRKSEMSELLGSFPRDVKVLNQALAACKQDNKDVASQVFAGVAWQLYAKDAVSPAREIFIRQSENHLKKAQKLCKKQKDFFMCTRIDLMRAENVILRGNHEKGMEYIKAMLNGLEGENRSLAYYYLVAASLEVDNMELAASYYMELKSTEGNEDFVRLVRNDFE
jgi:thiol-disulfide isomerase/thioredoxin